MEFTTVGMLGFGVMGAGIVHVVAQSGRDVVVLEMDQEKIDQGMAFLGDFLAEGVRRGKTSESERDTILGRVRGVTDAKDLADVDLVIEAVTERKDVKDTVLGNAARVVGTDVPILTNTSALSVTDLASSLPNPHRVAGLHFFNPAPLMKVIEIIRALQTDEGLIARLSDFVVSLGKDPVVAKDRPGFLVNWLLMPYINDVVQAFDEELASAEDIDIAVKLGLGHKQGPLELLDLIGLDVHEHATTSAYEATMDPRFAAPPLLRQMVAAGYLGNKNGRGFRTQEVDAT